MIFIKITLFSRFITFEPLNFIEWDIKLPFEWRTNISFLDYGSLTCQKCALGLENYYLHQMEWRKKEVILFLKLWSQSCLKYVILTAKNNNHTEPWPLICAGVFHSVWLCRFCLRMSSFHVLSGWPFNSLLAFL